jgi:hypothetical protein
MMLHRIELRISVLLLALVLLPHARCATKELVLRWDQLMEAAGNRPVTVELEGGKRFGGVIVSAGPDVMRVSVRSSSGKLASAPQVELVSRKELLAIRIREIKGHGRLIAAATTGAAVSLGSLPWAISESRVNVSDAKRIGQWTAISAAGVACGYAIGRLFDRKETVIHIRQ